ncbi:MAG: Competence protein ComM [Pseudomonadota bacterium]|jgi:magnesium chelatase family protein
MIANIKTVAFLGIEVLNVEVQVHFAKGQPGLTIVGLGDKVVGESRDRIRAAFNTIGLVLPPSRITVNLAPADVLKEGSHFDLPIAIGVLICMDILKIEMVQDYIIVGELGLDSSIRGMNGVLPAAMHASVSGCGFVCPAVNGEEAAWAGENVDLVAVENLVSLINHFKGMKTVPRPKVSTSNINRFSNINMKDIRGNKDAVRAMEVAASGGHNIIMIGFPGTGKSMLAARLNTILPPLDVKEMLEVSMIHSVAGLIKDGTLSTVRPFRSPHHSASMPSIIGGGRASKPGEITIAHNGVLFLDEIAEYPRQILDSLRQPMESGEVLVSRINAKVTYPARFQLVAAMNPCPCGFFGDPNRQCGKVPKCALYYQGKVSGPIMDRIDIHIKMNQSNHKAIYSSGGGLEEEQNEDSEVIKKRVAEVRRLQKERYKNYGISINADVDGALIREFCVPKGQKSIDVLDTIVAKLNLSMRGTSKLLKIARTLADMEMCEDILEHHITEAAFLRKGSLLQ